MLIRVATAGRGMGFWPFTAGSVLPSSFPMQLGQRQNCIAEQCVGAPLPGDSIYAAPPAPVPPGGPTTLAQETIPGAWTPDQAIAAGVDATQAQNLAFFSNLSSQLDAQAGNNNTWLYVAIGLVAVAALLVLLKGR